MIWRHEDPRLAYCPIEGVASSSWSSRIRAMGSTPGERWGYPPGQASFKINADMRRGYFSFIFVREPLERLVSAYFSKAVRSNYKNWQSVIPKDLFKLPREQREYPDMPTFEEFVYYLLHVVGLV